MGQRLSEQPTTPGLALMQTKHVSWTLALHPSPELFWGWRSTFPALQQADPTKIWSSNQWQALHTLSSLCPRSPLTTLPAAVSRTNCRGGCTSGSLLEATKAPYQQAKESVFQEDGQVCREIRLFAPACSPHCAVRGDQGCPATYRHHLSP